MSVSNTLPTFGPASGVWLTRLVAKVRGLFAATQALPTVPSLDVISPVVEPVTLQPAASPVRRMLAARIACHAKLNVPAGKKPRVARVMPARKANRRPKAVTTVKKVAPKARAVYLPARHVAAKAQPIARSNNSPLPVKTLRAATKSATARTYRLAA